MAGMGKAAALEYATEHIFSMGLDDAAAVMSEMNMAWGLAKIHHVQTVLGDEPDATFIGTPDLTVTRNVERWNAGIGYGGKITWGDGSRPYCFPEVKPNACGMLVGGMHELPTLSELAARVHELTRETPELDGVKVDWDLGVGNHFIDVMAVEPVLGDLDLPPYAFVLHFSGGELRGDGPLGMGLYWHDSEELRRRCRMVDTPWGAVRVLEGEDAAAYYEFFLIAAEFSERRRRLVADRVFGCCEGYEVIANLVVLGCQSTTGGGLVPIMLRESTPGYLFRALPNIEDDVIDLLGWGDRAREHGVIDQIHRANIIPHGAGYMLEGVARVLGVEEIGDTRYFRVEATEGGVEMLIGSPRDLVYAYRGRRVILKAAECRLGEIAARMKPLYVLKD